MSPIDLNRICPRLLTHALSHLSLIAAVLPGCLSLLPCRKSPCKSCKKGLR